LGGVITVACVRVGTKYGPEYVDRLESMAARHLASHRFVCLTDQPDTPGETIDVSACGLDGWWAKMCLFDRRLIPGRVLFFDLDTVILNDLTPLAEWGGAFGICESFTRRAGNLNWPCRYGSCVMSIGPGFGQDIWERFDRDRDAIMRRCTRGDQQAIEALHPTATLLQDELPEGFFMGYRDLTDTKPDASVIVFGGRRKPGNSPYQWVTDAWR
jgi:hypothetical protein